ncbi:MAG: DUF2845 domain-containing protein [Nitrospirae bacterium]|nr:DUF2845 domain-containing protein [Candidatus Manganitrophaceae bacterium]
MRFALGPISFQLGVVWGLLFLMGQVDTLYACDAPAVSIGQTKGEVKAICGAPSSIEKQKGGKRSRDRHAGDVEAWHYNLGPQQLVRVLRFEKGRLTQIETGGYGWTAEGAADYGCEQAVLPTGSTKAEVKARCGKPTSIQKKEGPYETWRYNLGPSRFVRIFQFQGGRLVGIKTGDYGK